MLEILKLLLLGCATVSSFLTTSSTCIEQPPTDEVTSLVTLYNSTRGAQWRHQWPISANESISSYNPCLAPWYGVTCGNTGPGSNCHVVELVLNSNLLQGPLLPSLANLTQLVVLRLFDNELTGIVPPFFDSMKSLVVAELSANRFRGTLSTPGPQMRFYSASFNEFSGSIPEPLLQNSLLMQLALSSNMLTGPVPDFSAMQSLVELLIDDNLPFPAPWRTFRH